MNALGAAAVQYAENYGWQLFPCKPGGKTPATGHGFKDATADTGKIRQWWAQSAYNIGMPTAGLVVIDIDGEQGYATWAELSNELSLNEMTVSVLTGGGGKHLWYRVPEGVEIKCGTGVLGPGIDVRANGGYVVIPPSETEAAYEWVMDPEMTDIAPLPPDLAARLVPAKREPPPLLEIPQGRARQVYWSNKALGKIDSGMGRNEAGLWLSTQLRDDGLTIEQAMPVLKQFAKSATTAAPKDHEYEFDEALASLRSAYAREPRDPAPEPLSHPASQAGNTAAINGAFSLDLAKAHALNQFTLGDDGNSQRYALLCGGRIKHCEALGWTYWDGKHWQSSADQPALALAKRTVRTMYAAAAFATSDSATKALLDHAKRTEHSSRLQAMLTLAKPEPTIMSRYEVWDTDLYALNVANGTVDLATGELRKHNPADRITKLSPVVYDSTATSLLWETFLHTVFDDNNHLIDFMQRLIGYSLCGHTREDRFALLWGSGANGKTTLLNTIRHLMGTYASHVRPETFMSATSSGVPNELAALEGRRFVTTVETDEGRKFAEGLLKQFTGGEPIQCRFLHREFFTYVPEGHLFVASNHRPVIKGTDDAIWRRVLLIPFTVTIPPENRDRMLCDRLKEEASAILNWCLDGYRKYAAEGLNPPDEVLAAVQDYRAEQNLIGQFLDECCETGDEHEVKCSDLRNRYNQWCADNGERAMTSQMFGRRIAEQGFEFRQQHAAGVLQLLAALLGGARHRVPGFA